MGGWGLTHSLLTLECSTSSSLWLLRYNITRFCKLEVSGLSFKFQEHFWESQNQVVDSFLLLVFFWHLPFDVTSEDMVDSGGILYYL